MSFGVIGQQKEQGSGSSSAAGGGSGSGSGGGSSGAGTVRRRSTGGVDRRWHRVHDQPGRAGLRPGHLGASSGTTSPSVPLVAPTGLTTGTGNAAVTTLNTVTVPPVVEPPVIPPVVDPPVTPPVIPPVEPPVTPPTASHLQLHADRVLGLGKHRVLHRHQQHDDLERLVGAHGELAGGHLPDLLHQHRHRRPQRLAGGAFCHRHQHRHQHRHPHRHRHRGPGLEPDRHGHLDRSPPLSDKPAATPGTSSSSRRGG